MACALIEAEENYIYNKLSTQSRCTKLGSLAKKLHAGCRRLVLVLVS